MNEKCNADFDKEKTNNQNYNELNYGINVMDIIGMTLGKEGFFSFCLGKTIEYLLIAEKRNKKEDYKKAIKYLERAIEVNNKISYFTDIEDFEKEFYVTWSQIISEIAKDLNVKKAFKLDSIFRNIFNENYETAFDELTDFIEEYEE